MLVKYWREYIVAIAIVLTGVLLFRLNDTYKTISKYTQKESALNRKLDSLEAIRAKTTLEALKALTDLNLAKAQLRAQKEVTAQYKKNYEVLKNKPVPHLSDAGIDSATRRLYPLRPH